MKIRAWQLIPLLLLSLLLWVFWRGLSLEPHHIPSVQIGKVLPNFQVPVLKTTDSLKSIEWLTPSLFKGRVVLLNVWASWCTACMEEQAFLLELAQTGIAIYGLNYKDDPEKAKHWLLEWGNPYQLIGADRTGKLAIDLGVYGTPETFIIDKQGIIRYRHVGVLNKWVWQAELLARMQELEAEKQ